MKEDDVSATQEDRAAALDPELALRALIESPVPPLPRAQARYLQQRISCRIEQLAAQEAARRARSARLRRALAAVAALAAIFAGVILVLRPGPAAPVAAQVTALRGSVEIASGESTRSAPSLTLVPLAHEEELRTGEAALARASLATGATVEIGPSSRVRFSPSGGARDRFDDTITLERGRISLEVPPLPAGVTLSVHASDTVVTVHGTRFSVETTAGLAGEPAETRVSVVEGRVSVRRGGIERFLDPGQTWSSRDEELRGDSPAGDRSGGAPAPSQEADQDGSSRDGAAAGAASAPRDPPRAAPRTTLTIENELLANAMDARRRGQPRRAIEQLDRLLGRYPDSPLAEIARMERQRALEMLGEEERAAPGARRPLNDTPQGAPRRDAGASAGGTRP